MLPWLQRVHHNILPRHRFLAQLACATFCAHIVLFGMLFFVYGVKTYAVRLSHTSDAIFVLVPLQHSGMSVRARKVGASSTPVEEVVSQSEEPSELHTTSIVDDHKERAKRRALLREKQRAKQRALARKKREEKKRALRAKMRKEKDRLEKERKERMAHERQKTSALVTPQSVVPERISSPVTSSGVVQETEGSPDVVLVGQQEWDFIQLEREVCASLAEQWHPPVGMDHLGCRVAVSVGLDGHVEHIQIEQPSKVLAFDTSVCSALKKTVFPTCAFGKQLVIPFGKVTE